MIDTGFHAAAVKQLLTRLRLKPGVLAAILIPYYLLTTASALMEGVGMVVIVGLFTGGVTGNLATLGGIPALVVALGGHTGFPAAVPFLIALFGINLAVRITLLAADGVMTAVLRQRTQEAVFSGYLMGDWSHMRAFRVGDAVGTTTQEAIVVAKYLTAVVSTGYYAFGAVVLVALALITSPEITVAFGFIALPLALVLERSFTMQSRLSRNAAAIRNEFSADITDRLSGLLQIHVDDNYAFHRQQSLRAQSQLTRLDVLTGLCSAVIGSFSLMMPLAALVGYAVWSAIAGPSFAPNLALVASVGILGLRLAAQVTGAVAALGNMSRLSGSLYPVLDALNTPVAPVRQRMNEATVRVELHGVGYSYGDQIAVSDISMVLEKGAPVVLSGRSGKGKTTLANLVAGLYFPSEGRVVYVGASGQAFPSTTHRAKVGFVTQDIYLFRGSLRSNLAAGRPCSDAEIWSVLEQVDAADFVRAMGGLDTESAEAGRSLSGGQRRRLGIARVILSGSDVLIFDEVTAGLDQINRAAVVRVIERLSERYLVLVVSHEPFALSHHMVVAV